MLWLVPHLFPDPRLLEIAGRGLHVPGLRTLLARGTHVIEPCEGTEEALCRALGIARQQDWPLAPITLQADGGEPGEAYWLRADPACFQVMRDRVVLAATGPADLTRDESDALAAAIVDHFGDTLPLLAPHPQRWYLRYAATPDLVTHPPSLASGRAIDSLLPGGEAAKVLRVAMNELQMLLYAHPVNQAREAHGRLPVNALWVWGGGRRPAIPDNPPTVYAHAETARAIADHCRAPCLAVPATLDTGLFGKRYVLVLDALAEPACMHDALGWREALLELEKNWFAPLAAGLRRIGHQGLRIVDPISGRGQELRRADAWKIWRRPRNLVSGVA